MCNYNKKKIYMWICHGARPWVMEKFIESWKDDNCKFCCCKFFLVNISCEKLEGRKCDKYSMPWLIMALSYGCIYSRDQQFKSWIEILLLCAARFLFFGFSFLDFVSLAFLLMMWDNVISYSFQLLSSRPSSLFPLGSPLLQLLKFF